MSEALSTAAATATEVKTEEAPHQQVHVYCILDSSGSMSPFSESTMTAVNTLIQNQKKDQEKLIAEQKEGETKPVMKLSACYFANTTKQFLDGVPIEDVKLLDAYDCIGSTALNDAIAQTILDLESKVQKDEKVLIYVFTDGQENASKKYKTKEVAKLVEKKREEGWEVSFLGANQDASKEGGKYSIPVTSCVNFEQSHTGISDCFENINMHLSSSKRGFHSSISIGSKRSREDEDDNSWMHVSHGHDLTATSHKKMKV